MKWSDEAEDAAIAKWRYAQGSNKEVMSSALTAAVEAEIRAGRAYRVTDEGKPAIILRIETDKDKDNG